MTGIEYNSRYNLQENTMFDREQITGYVSADDVCVIIQDRCEIIMSERYGCYLIQVEELSKRDIVSEGKIDELLLDAFRDNIVYGIDAE